MFKAIGADNLAPSKGIELALPGIAVLGINKVSCVLRLRHQMETFSALLAICTGKPPVTGGFSSQRPVTRSFDVFFDIGMRLNKRLRKQSKRR